MVVIANRRNPFVLISSELKYDGRPSQRSFLRDKLEFGLRRQQRRKPLWMGDIEDGVSHFLCPDHPTWLLSQRYEVTVGEKQQALKELSDRWHQGLADGTYTNRADIVHQYDCSRAWVTRVLGNRFAHYQQ
ncbi:MAG: hypothetical protein P9X24_03290 [Candidatus Hatepunaea meridiana]|nr:hypothetical protein [Candidatus Hatepunaea meridiana]